MKLGVFIIFLAFSISTIKAEGFLTSEQLIDRYPDIASYSERPENKKILCPFHRMLERSGVYDNSKKDNQIIVGIYKIVKAARTFGCKIAGCSLAATIASSGQTTYLKDVIKGHAMAGKVNVTALHKARGLAHDCGLTFAKGGTEVDDQVRANTLKRLEELSVDGKLTEDNLFTVKQEICDSQEVEMSFGGKVEVGLIYTYLGGHDRGYIEYTDVEKFLHASMPDTISKEGV